MRASRRGLRWDGSLMICCSATGREWIPFRRFLRITPRQNELYGNEADHIMVFPVSKPSENRSGDSSASTSLCRYLPCNSLFNVVGAEIIAKKVSGNSLVSAELGIG